MSKTAAVDVESRVCARREGIRQGPPGKAGRMSSSSVLNVGGKIFAMFVKGKFVAKLPRDRVSELVRTGAGELFDPGHGRLMKEWVAMSGRSATWVALAKEAHGFVKGKRKYDAQDLALVVGAGVGGWNCRRRRGRHRSPTRCRRLPASGEDRRQVPRSLGQRRRRGG